MPIYSKHLQRGLAQFAVTPPGEWLPILPAGKVSPLQPQFNQVEANVIAAKAFMDAPNINKERVIKLLSTLYVYGGLRNLVSKKFNGQAVTNAWLKIYEIVSQFGLKKYLLEPVNSPLNQKITMYGNAELPGAFISSVNHYAHTHSIKMEWVASSLLPSQENDALEDKYGIMANNRSKWLMDSTNDGNITNPANLRGLNDRVRKVFPDGVLLYTSDAGIDVGNCFNNQEFLNLKIHYGQIIMGVLTLKKGGMFVTKHYTVAHPFTISMIVYLSQLFCEFFIVKPVTSRAANSEIYLVGRGFKGTTEADKEMLLTRLDDPFETTITPLVDLTLADASVQSIYFAVNLIHNKQQVAFLKEIEMFYHQGEPIAKIARGLEPLCKQEINTWLTNNPIQPIAPQDWI